MNIASAILNRMGVRSPSDITTLFIHHSDADPATDIADLARMETAFLTIGYNAVCRRVDTVRDLWVMQQGRPLWAIPAAQVGMNVEGYAICLGGRYQPSAAPQTDAVSDRALVVIAGQVHQVKVKCPNLKYLAGHRDVATIMRNRGKNPGFYATACPGSRLYDALDHLRDLTGLEHHPEVH